MSDKKLAELPAQALASARSDWARGELRSVMRRLMAFQGERTSCKTYGIMCYDFRVEVACREHEHLKEFGYYDHGKGEWVKYDVPRNLEGYDYNRPPVERKMKYAEVTALIIERRDFAEGVFRGTRGPDDVEEMRSIYDRILAADAVAEKAVAGWKAAAAAALERGGEDAEEVARIEAAEEDVYRNFPEL